MPVQPGEILPSREMSVISVITSAAPPTARLPRWTRCQSFGIPSSPEYWHIGETTTRFFSFMPRSSNGVNIGGGGGSIPDAPLRAANQRSTPSMNFGSRTLKLSWVILLLRHNNLIANCSGSKSFHLLIFSNHCWLTSAARCNFATSSQRPSS